MRRAVVIAALLLATVIASAAPSRATVRNWIEDVILGPEYGGEGAICSRWTKSPTLSVFGGTRAHQALTRRVVAHLNETLAQTPVQGIELVEPENEQADIRVYFVPLSEMGRVAKENGFPYVEGNLGYFWTFWNGRHEITKAVVLLGSDARYRDALPHFTLEEITQSLGLSGDSAELPSSIFYSHDDEDHPYVETLSALDRKLIAFLYTRIRPGAAPAEVRRAFDRHW